MKQARKEALEEEKKQQRQYEAQQAFLVWLDDVEEREAAAAAAAALAQDQDQLRARRSRRDSRELSFRPARARRHSSSS